MARQQSKGRCNLCGGTFSKRAISKHLKACMQEKDTSGISSSSKTARKIKTFHLMVEGQYLPYYWMHIEVPAGAKLSLLDNFLRDIWLECCDHLSAFTIEGKVYSIEPMKEFNDCSMNVRLEQVLTPGMKFYYEYDFGSTTYLALKVISQQQSKITSRDIKVLARNDPPLILCVSCGKTATQVCVQCLWEDEGWLCDNCAAEHECGEDMCLPVVNSPRVGVCGYTGQ